MLVPPNTFPTQNNHRIALFQPDIARTDFDQIEDIGADAIASARYALGQLEQLPHATLKPIDGFIRTVRIGVYQRRVMSDDFQQAALSVLNHLAREDPINDSCVTLGLSMRHLRDALNQSHRVKDLLAAERDIGLRRGL